MKYLSQARVQALFLLLLFLFGLSNINGYGRPIDEGTEQKILLGNILEYGRYFHAEPKSSLYSGIKTISDSVEIDHGIAGYYPIVPLLSATADKPLLRMQVWHIYTYILCFLGTLSLFFILKELYPNPLTAYLGVLLYFFTPRIYAESHYNNKDMAFLAFVFMMLVFAVRLLKRWKIRDLVLFSAASGFLMNVKILGIAIWGLTGLFMILYAVIHRQEEGVCGKKRGAVLLSAAILSAFVFFLLTPAMWSGPVHYLRYCLLYSMRFDRWDNVYLFGGRELRPVTDGVPRLYLLQWICMTTPVYILVLFAVSIVLFIRNLFRRLSPREQDLKLFYGLWIASFLFPFGFFIISSQSVVLYNGWRHNYYLYAYMVLCAAYTIDCALRALRVGDASENSRGNASKDPRRNSSRDSRGNRKVILPALLVGYMSVGFFAAFADMMINRSFEYVYYNPIARVLTDQEGYEGDYWNVSVMPTVREFGKTLQSEATILPVGYAFKGQIEEFTAGKVLFEKSAEEADYYIFNTSSMLDKETPEGYEEVFALKKYGRPLCTVCKKIR